MAIRERLVYAIDVVTDGANRGLSNFRTAVGQADTATGKFKAGASSAFDTIKANAGALALSGGAALVAFGAKAVSAFQETAIEAGKFSDATGLAVEDASRWIEVAGDVGVSTETMQGAFVKLNKALATGDLEKFGVELQRTSSGAVDVNATMLNAIKVIGGIRDPTERAAAAQKAFGKSYAEAAEIIFDNADNVKKKLDEVSDAKVINEEELEKARRFREAMDNLHDSLEDITLVIGETLVPVVSDVAEELTDAAGAAKTLGRAFDAIPGMPKAVQLWWDFMSPKAMLADNVTKLAGKVGDLGKSMFGLGGGADDAADKIESFTNTAHNMAGVARGEAASGVQEVAEATAEYGDRLTQFHEKVDLATAAIEMKAAADEEAAAADKHAAEMAERHAEAVEAVADAMEDQRQSALDLVGGDIAVRNAQRRAKEAADELNETLDDQETTMYEAGAAIDDAAEAQLDAAAAAADYRAQQMEANGQTVDARTKAQLMKEELENIASQLTGPLKQAILDYIAQLGAIPRTVGTTIVLTRPGRVGDTLSGSSGSLLGGSGRRAAGGPTVAGGSYEVNEGGRSELLTEGGRTYLMAGANGEVTPLSGAGGMGNNYYLTVNAGIQANGHEISRIVMDAIKKHERFAGPGWRS